MRIAVIGAGSWGSWASLMLLEAGYEVTLFDMDRPGNGNAGSGGYSRIIRLVYGKDDIYVRMTRRAFDLWDELFEATGSTLYRETGVLWMVSGNDDQYLADSLKVLGSYGEKLEEISLTEAGSRWPHINMSDLKSVYYEPRAGILDAAECCELVVSEFQRKGGDFIRDRIRAEGNSLIRSDGVMLDFDKYIVAAGSWTSLLFPELLNKYCYVSRQEVFFYEPEFYPSYEMPLWFDYDPTAKFYYGFPQHKGHGIKIAYDTRDVPMDPDNDTRMHTQGIEEECRNYMNKRFPAYGELVLSDSRVCHYDNSNDGDFIFCRHPSHENILIMTGSSGHGFKMGPSIGELARDFVQDRDLPELFSLERFGRTLSKTTQFSIT